MKLIVILGFIVAMAGAGWSHPGDLDSKGGHTCQTNCEKYDLKYGEYHIHRQAPSPIPSPEPEPEPEPEPDNLPKPFFNDSIRICFFIGSGVIALLAVPLVFSSKLRSLIKRKKL
ncbi:YHYH domain-containing protein [Desulfococcaceae bacterium HSG7]|nr:YHYH domain-containing protein [Desulfococcaceae bacterium HSG7]